MFQLENKREDEEIIICLKRHPLFMLKGIKLILGIILAVVCAFIVFRLGAMSWSNFLYVSIILIIIGVIILFYYLFLWNNDLIILTNYRIVDIDQHELFHRTVTETDLDNIQETTHKIHGLFNTIFGYGEVIIQTAGPAHNIILENIPKPSLVQHQINEAKLKYIKEKNIHRDETN